MDKKEIIEKSLKDIFKFIGVSPKVSIETTEENVYNVIISGDNLSFLIGFRGKSLTALQNTLGLILYRKTNEWTTVTVDVNNYRTQKVERIQELTKKFIDRVRFFQEETTMPPMDPWERKEVHTMVSEYDDVTSESIGEGIGRRVVLKPKK